MDKNEIVEGDTVGHSMHRFEKTPADDVEGHLRSRVDAEPEDDTRGHGRYNPVQPQDSDTDDDTDAHMSRI